MSKLRNALIGTASAALLTMGMSGVALAVPDLQLDLSTDTGTISYDTTSETIIVSGDDTFSVWALGKDGTTVEGGTYRLSVAIVPKTTTAGTYGSFDIGGTTVDVTGGMTYGTPPFEILMNNKDLPGHGIYDTWYKEIGFTFAAGDKAYTEYNSMDNPGGPSAGTTMYGKEFAVDISNLADGIQLHFDLYQCTDSGCTEIAAFAPFSHDAQTGDIPPPPPPIIAEPGMLASLGVGLVLLGLARRRKQTA